MVFGDLRTKYLTVRGLVVEHGPIQGHFEHEGAPLL